MLQLSAPYNQPALNGFHPRLFVARAQVKLRAGITEDVREVVKMYDPAYRDQIERQFLPAGVLVGLKPG